MKVLLDTNIIIHRESHNSSNLSIGQLFYWLDKLKYEKYVHPITHAELKKYEDANLAKSMSVKLESYNVLKTLAPINDQILNIIEKADKNENDINDSHLLNEVIQERVDLFITEDKKIHAKARQLGAVDKVSTIIKFVELCVASYPELANYKVLSIKKTYFGDLKINDPFFDSFRRDYLGFDKWFNRKSDEIAYVCEAKNRLAGFLYIKLEDENEIYNDIKPVFAKKRRLKIGTFKVSLNGYRIGERFVKIIFDHALKFNVSEIYVTIFDKTQEQLLLIELLEEWGFKDYGIKHTPTGDEKVLCRSFEKRVDIANPKTTFPFISRLSNLFIVPIFPDYHTELLPDSILNNESPYDFVENMPHRNALSKVYISHSIERGLKKGDVIVFYRTGGYYAGVATTIGIVDAVYDKIDSLDTLINICRKKTFFSEEELAKFWNKNSKIRPFVVEFIYNYTLPKRPNLAKLIEIGVIKDVNSAPRGFTGISLSALYLILKNSNSDESIIVD